MNITSFGEMVQLQSSLILLSAGRAIKFLAGSASSKHEPIEN